MKVEMDVKMEPLPVIMESPFELNKNYTLTGYIGSPIDIIQQGRCKVHQVKGGWIQVSTVRDNGELTDERWLNMSALHMSSID